MKFFRHAVGAFFLAFAVAAYGAPVEAPVAVAPHYVAPESVDLHALLPDPPADGSPETLREIDTLLALQKARTPELLARAKTEETLSPYLFAEVLGAWFAPAPLPLTDALLKNVDSDLRAATASAKKFWNRPRPPLQDQRIVPAVALPASASYPSGHSTRAVVFALLLAELAPDKKDALLQRAYVVGDDREAAGVHFPSDVEAGRKLGKALAARFLADPAFQADLAAARIEFNKARPAK